MATGGGFLALSATRREAGEILAAFGPLLLGGLTLYCLDGGNVFDCLPLADWLRRASARAPAADVREIFSERIFLSRAFTCHQLAGAVDELLRPLAGDRPVAALRRPVVALILGVEEMFLDEDIRLAERRYLFGRILARTAELTRQGLPVLITCGQSGPNPFARRLAGHARMLPHIHKALPVLSRQMRGD